MQHSRRIQLLKNRYHDSDKFDIHSHYDRKLSYSENKRLLDAKAKRRGLVRKSVPSLHFRHNPIYFFHKAKLVNKSRSLRSQVMEDRRTNKHIFKASTLTREQFLLWKKYPARFDIIGIDSREVNPGLRAKLIQTKIDIDRINREMI